MPHPPSILPEPYRPPTREEIERARDMYAQGFTVSRILAATDMSLGTFYAWLDGGPAENGATLYPPMPRRRRVVGKRRRPLAEASRLSLAARLWRSAERQARDIEERLARPSGSTPSRERDVRMLAMLVRTLRELAAFERGEAVAQAAGDDGAAQAAQQRMTRAAEIRATESSANLLRDVLRSLRYAAATVAEARGQRLGPAAEASPAALDEMQRELARRVAGFMAAEGEGG